MRHHTGRHPTGTFIRVFPCYQMPSRTENKQKSHLQQKQKGNRMPQLFASCKSTRMLLNEHLILGLVSCSSQFLREFYHTARQPLYWLIWLWFPDTRPENGRSNLMTTSLPRLKNMTPGSKSKPDIIWNIMISLEGNLGFCSDFFLHFPCSLQVVQIPTRNALPPAGRAIST